jgi:hypothetical protein
MKVHIARCDCGSKSKEKCPLRIAIAARNKCRNATRNATDRQKHILDKNTPIGQ